VSEFSLNVDHATAEVIQTSTYTNHNFYKSVISDNKPYSQGNNQSAEKSIQGWHTKARQTVHAVSGNIVVEVWEVTCRE
jgi:hypothetical protein